MMIAPSLLLLLVISADAPPAFENPRAVKNGLVVSVEPHASRVGCEVLRDGGNAVDAAVATAFALAVTHPEAGNLGGGGFMVVRLGKTGECFTVDFREKAPKLATATMFLDDKGTISKQKSDIGWHVVGVPGSPMGLWTTHQKAGVLQWKRVVQPAVELAAKGFVVDGYLARGLGGHQKVFASQPGSAAPIAFSGGQTVSPEQGDLLRQPELAHTLELIRDKGPDGFYKGEIADRLDAAMQQNGGLVRKEDLAEYKAVVRTPVRGTYRGFEIIGMPPPSSGGVAVVEMLNILEGFDLKKLGPQTPASLHLLTEAMRRAFHDRAKHLGDSDFSSVPLEMLTSKKHAEELRKSIDLRRASSSEQIGADILTVAEKQHTTHFSVADKDGNLVACTTTLEDAYGAKVMAPGTGFLLNNEMHDFNLKPGLTDSVGHVGTPPNVVAPGKRMLSSMSPTLVLKDGKPYLVLGSPGGRTIINTVLQVLLNVVEYDMDVQAAVDAGRIHHQWQPDQIKPESRLPTTTLDELKKLGHSVAPPPARGRRVNQGDCHAIRILPDGSLRPGVDHRLRGSAVGF